MSLNHKSGIRCVCGKVHNRTAGKFVNRRFVGFGCMSKVFIKSRFKKPVDNFNIHTDDILNINEVV
jgi:hypothetical protein